MNLVGGELPPPCFPKDDSIISRKATPKSKGARPCRHCGSDLHWDNKCKHSKKGMRTARTRLAECSIEELQDQDSYNELYYGLRPGFCLGLQTAEASHPEVQATVLEGHVTENQEGNTYISSANTLIDSTLSHSINPNLLHPPFHSQLSELVHPTPLVVSFIPNHH